VDTLHALRFHLEAKFSRAFRAASGFYSRTREFGSRDAGKERGESEDSELLPDPERASIGSRSGTSRGDDARVRASFEELHR
jgi:hypothetical protein